jgi:hypothetical protein
MPRWTRLLLLVGPVVACQPAAYQLSVRAVGTSGTGVADAVVGAECKPAGNAADLTAGDGRAHLAVRSNEPLESCDVVVAKQGMTTAEVAVDCAGGACRPVEVTMEPAP